MLLGFKTELKLNNQQKTLLAKHAGTARHAWNWGNKLCKDILENNKNNPESKIKFPTAIDLHKWLVALVKPENPWYYESSKCAPQYALRHLADAWKNCFNKKKGRPKFKKKGGNDSFTLDGSIKVDHFKISLPKIGWVKTYERLPQGIIPKSVTISRQADRWLISFKIETEPQTTTKIVAPVGVDLGVKNLATLSTGEVFKGAKSYRKLEHKLARLQRIVSRKEFKSNNWHKAQLKVALLHKRIADIRKDTLHKLTTYLTKNHGQIVIEDLNVSGMLANHKLAKSIADMGFFEFRRQLDYKSQLYNSELIVADRWFPSSKTCSNCGAIKESLSLGERTYQCDSCFFVIERDLNAAINLARHCGLGGFPKQQMSQEADIGRATTKFTPVERVLPTVLAESGM
ncbi:MAG: RNA-guided endonuclease InsQ/TnpB family protein, partial [Waterburya sp.]